MSVTMDSAKAMVEAHTYDHDDEPALCAWSHCDNPRAGRGPWCKRHYAHVSNIVKEAGDVPAFLEGSEMVRPGLAYDVQADDTESRFCPTRLLNRLPVWVRLVLFAAVGFGIVWSAR